MHLVVIVATIAFVELGLWQWHRYQSPSGSAQNLIYAFQWPSFALFGFYLWGRTARDIIRGEEDGRSGTGEGDAATDVPMADPDTGVVGPVPEGALPQRGGRGDEPFDPELDAYNQYLRRLSSADQRQGE